ASEIAYSDWIYNNQTLELSNAKYTFLLGSKGQSLLIKFDAELKTLNKNECIDLSQTTICFNSSQYLPDLRDYKAYVDIVYYKPEIEIDRSVDNNILKIGESAVFTVVIKNKGEYEAKDIVFTDEFPKEFHIDDITGECIIDDDKIYWKGNLDVAESKTCTYTFYTSEEVDVNLNAAAEYYDGFSSQTKYSDETHIYSSSVLKIEIRTTKSKVQIGEEVEVSLNLTNLEEKKIEISNLQISFPEGLIIDRAPLSKKGNAYIWDGELEAEKKEDFTFKLRGKLTGVSVVQGTLDYEYEDIVFPNIAFKEKIEVEEKGITFDSNIADNKKFDANQKIEFILKAKNNNIYTDLIDIDLKFETELLKFPADEFDMIEKNRTKVIVNGNSFAPDANTTIKYPVNVTLNYDSLYGEHFEESLYFNIIVEPIKKLVITKSYNPGTIEEGQVSEITVNVKNERNTDIDNIFVYETLPAGLKIDGSTSNYINLKKGETKTAYTYKITGPSLFNDTEYEINSSARYEEEDGKNYLFIGSQILKVVPKRLQITITKQIPNQELYAGQYIPVTYTLQNKEKDPAFNLVLHASEGQGYDTVNNFVFLLPTLNPGETVKIQKEQIRPKKEGKIVVDGSLLEYEDKAGRSGQALSSSVSLDVKESFFEGPAVIIEKSANTSIAAVGDPVKITVKFENIGSDRASINVRDIAEHLIDVDAGESEEISYDLILEEEGEIELLRTEAEYSYQNNVYHTFSNKYKIKVLKEKLPDETSADIAVDSTSNDETNSSNTDLSGGSLYERSVLKKIIDWFKGLFRKKVE
ncbi:MAG: DUF11 domain-containing protein, partial [Nanoarchaeota archaeon]|nr:DUF11 domain-containing protein [Nanoarchaeota archaeon]